MHLIIDSLNKKLIGWGDYADNFNPGGGLSVVSAPENFSESNSIFIVIEGSSVSIDMEAWLRLLRESTIQKIKTSTANQIESLAWRLDRAKERDTIGALGETVSEIMIIRESIRRASSRAEAEVMQLTTAAEVAAYTWEVTPADTPVPTRMTIYAFLLRFTNDEAVAIDLASYGETAEAAGVRRYMSLVTNALSIDLSLAELRDGVNALEATGILAEGRATEILDTPVDRTEAPI